MEKIKDYKKIFMYRSFRDTLMAWLHWNDTPKRMINPTGYRFSSMQRHYRKIDDKLMWLIENVFPYFRDMMKWCEHVDVAVYYEDLLTRPRETLAPVADLLNIDLDTMVKNAAMRKSATYRLASPGHWYHHFTDEHLERFYEIWEPILEWDKTI